MQRALDGTTVTSAPAPAWGPGGYLGVARSGPFDPPYWQSGAPLLVAGSQDAMAWQVLDPSPVGADNIQVAGSDLGWVMVTSGFDSSTNTTLWFSADGRTWGMDHDPPAAQITGLPRSLVAGPTGFALTVGRADDSSVTGVWVSSDGRHWQATSGLGVGNIERLLITPSGYVAFGDDVRQASVSLDGRVWHSVVADPPTRPNTWVTLWIPTDDGAIALVDDDGAAGPQPMRVRVSRGPDGPTLRWEAGPTTTVFDDAGISGGATTGARQLILGYDAAYRTLAWTSVDGLDWSRQALPSETFGGGVPGSVAGGSQFLTMGWHVDSYGQVVRQPWTSGNGVDWTSVLTDGLGTATPPAQACPTSTTFEFDTAWLSVPSTQFASCFGGKTLRLRGWARDCGGCGGTGPVAGTPSWLIDALGFYALWLGGRNPGKGLGGGGFGVMVKPGVTLPAGVPSDTAVHVEVMGHFADPASSTCRLRQDPSVGGELDPPSIAIARCEATFVVTGARLLP